MTLILLNLKIGTALVLKFGHEQVLASSSILMNLVSETFSTIAKKRPY